MRKERERLHAAAATCRPRLRSFFTSHPLHSHQVWRLVTNFTFLGKPSITWLFQLVWL